MSIEIEVGLENATRVKPRTEELRWDEAPAAPQTNTKLRNRLIFGGAAVLLLVAGLFIYYFNRESTDDAQVDGHITAVAAKGYCRAVEGMVEDNQPGEGGARHAEP